MMTSAQSPTTWKDVFLNVDLLAPASVYLDKLDSWKDFAKSAASGESLSRLVYRYEQLWLPLLAAWESIDELAVPPDDVHWVWHLHQLQSDSYSSYCVQRFGRVLPHRLRPVQTATALQKTAGAWRQRYPGEPFDLPAGEVWTMMRSDTSQCGLIDLLTDLARREVDFTYQVALPHMRDATFLYTAVERYRKLLLLRRLRAGQIPTYLLPVDILLMIRVHALHPTQFIGDMRRLFGDVDSTAAMTVDWASLKYQFPPSSVVYQLDYIWQHQFGIGDDGLFISGSGLRGPRAGSVNCGGDETAMRQLSRYFVSRDVVESCDVTFTSVKIDEVWCRSRVKRIFVEARLLGQNSFAHEVLFRASGSIGATITGGKVLAPLGSAHFSVSHNRGIELAVLGRQGVLCFARQRTLTTKTFNPIQHCSVNGASTTVILPKATYTDPKITVAFSVQAAVRKPLVFTLDRNEASLRPISTSLRRFVGALRQWTNVIGAPDSLFLHSRHGLKCRDGGLGFGVEVIKHEHSDLSAVLLYLNNQHIVAAAYTIDNDLLPKSNQVSEVCPLSLDGSHAMLIRSHDGDFAVCTANWHHYSTFGDEMGCSRIQFHVYFINTRQVCTFDVREDEMQSIKLTSSEGGLQVDLPTGRITVDASVKSLAEYLTLAFTVGVIFVNMRRPPNMVSVNGSFPAGSVRSTVSTRAALRVNSNGRVSPTLSDTPNRRSAAARLVARSQVTSAVKKMNKRHRLSASFTFLLACGLQVDYALNGADSIGRASLGTGRHGNENAPAVGNAVYKTTMSPVTARRNQQQQPRIDSHQFIDIRL